MKTMITILVVIAGLLTITACSSPPVEPTGQAVNDEGVIYAKPENLSTSIPLSKALDFSAFFNKPDNRVKIQFPIEESAYAWVNMSKYYPTA